jgi:hypothetical protein
MQGYDGIDYKKKYMDLRARFVEALDIAFRTGYEQGYNESQIQSMAQQAQMQAQQTAMMQGQMGAAGTGDYGMEQSSEGEMSAPETSGQPVGPETGGDEMDAAIAELEQLVNKSEPSIEDMKKSLEVIKNNRMFQKLQKATKEAGKKMGQPPKPLSLSYKVNLPEDAKQAVSMQSKIVDDILKKWEQEAQNSARDITSILGTEALTKKE